MPLTITPNYFVSVGHNYFINAARVTGVIRVDTVQARQTKKNAMSIGKFLDYTYAHATKSLVILDDGTVIGCALSPETICKRLNAVYLPGEDG